MHLVEESTGPSNPEIPQAIQPLLSQYSDLFATPNSLPLAITHDHSINLQPGTSPISVYPYRYPYFQKDEIERIVKELMDSGVVRPSHSPYSSPVLLVRKVDG